MNRERIEKAPSASVTVTEVNEHLRLLQNPEGLTFGTDALLLAAFVPYRPEEDAAELGAGTGIVSMLCMTRRKLRHIDALEIQPEYAALCRRNFEQNGLSDRITAVEADLRDYRGADTDGRYGVVFTNPPYMKTDSGFRNRDDGKYLARHEVCGTIADFCHSAARLLRWGGAFYAVYRPDRLTDLLIAMRDSGIEAKRLLFVYPDTVHPPCLVLAEGKRGGKPSLITERPLFLYENGTTTLTGEARGIYENGVFDR